MSEPPKRRKRFYILIWSCGAAAVAILMTFAGHALYLNYTSFCRATGARLSDSELIDSAIPAATDMARGLEAKRTYADVAEFHQVNPRCCHLLRSGPEFEQEKINSLLDRLIGASRTLAVIWFEADTPRSRYVRTTVWMDSCGKVLERFSAYENIGP